MGVEEAQGEGAVRRREVHWVKIVKEELVGREGVVPQLMAIRRRLALGV